MAAVQAAENKGDEWDISWYLRWGMDTSIPTWTHSQNLKTATEALSLKVPFHGKSFRWSRRSSQLAQENS